MPKRSASSRIDYYENKLRKLKECTNKKRSRVIIYSSSSDSEENQDGTMQDDTNTTQCPPVLEHCDEASTPIPEAQVEPAHDEDLELDSELLSALGDPMDEQPTFGERIHHSLAQRWAPILKKGLAKDHKDKLLKEYQVPENCQLLKAPTLNPEIKAAVSDVTVNRDKNIQGKQDQLGLGITTINNAITLLLLGDDKIRAIKTLSDGCRILTDLHYTETQLRTKLITPCLDKSIMPLIKDHERDSTLFGEKLSETIKASRAIERQGLHIKKSAQKLTPVFASTAASSTRTRFPGNETRPPRYPSGNRGGRGLPGTPSSYRRGAMAQATTPARARAKSSYNSQRSHTRH